MTWAQDIRLALAAAEAVDIPMYFASIVRDNLCPPPLPMAWEIGMELDGQTGRHSRWFETGMVATDSL